MPTLVMVEKFRLLLSFVFVQCLTTLFRQQIPPIVSHRRVDLPDPEPCVCDISEHTQRHSPHDHGHWLLPTVPIASSCGSFCQRPHITIWMYISPSRSSSPRAWTCGCVEASSTMLSMFENPSTMSRNDCGVSRMLGCVQLVLFYSTS